MGRFFGLIVDDAADYVRYLAWTAATPKGSKITRAEMNKDLIVNPPDLCAWIVELSMECGLSFSGGMGVMVMPWSEIKAWSELTGWVDDVWITKTLRQLSVAYVNQYRISDDPSCRSPIEVDVEEQRKSVAGQLKRFISSRS